jgi:anti-sigma-K factor RskA
MCARVASSSSRSGAFSWARRSWAGLLCALLLLLAPPIAHGQSEKPPTLQDLKASILTANEALTQLVPLTAQQEKRIADLQADLVTLSGQLTDSQAELATSEAERLKVAASLESLWKQYNDLSLSFSAYRTEMQKQVAGLERERNFWRIAGIGGGTVTVVAIILAIAR